MKKMNTLGVAIATLSTLGTTSLSANTDILSNIKANGELRTRYEFVDDGSIASKDAKALTNRLLLGVKADLFGTSGFSTYAEFINVSHGSLVDDYAPESAGYALVADPVNNRLTQAYIDYKAGNTLIRGGRQMLNIDNQRFVGAVGWRQMPQTFEGFSITNTDIDKLTLKGSYLTRRLGIIDALTGDTKSVLLHAGYKYNKSIKLTAYGYLIGNIGDTYGIRLDGKTSANEVKINYSLEYANQNDASMRVNSGDFKQQVDADYINADLGLKYKGFIAGAAYEVLGEAANATDSHGFTTPFATLHKFNGWADVFLGRTATGNANGLEDLSLKVGYASKEFGKALAIYHEFDAETGANSDLGDELDLLYVTKIPSIKGLSAMAKASFYNAGDAGNDVTKYWLMLDYKFGSK